jgi:RHS repeat-associated protein
VVWDAVRKPFGERTVAVGQVEVLLGFPGQYFDEETGNFYNYRRDYDPTTGRYLQSDPIGLAGGINTYAYVGGNPNKYTDQYGLFCIPCAVVVVAVGTGISIWWQNTDGPGSFDGASNSGDDSDSNVVPFPDRCKDNYCDELEKKITLAMTALALTENAAAIRALVDSINSLIDDYNRMCGDMDYLDLDDYLGPQPIE